MLEVRAPAPPLGLITLGNDSGAKQTYPFEPNDQLLLYTDGVTEARDANREFYPLDERVAVLAPQALPKPAKTPKSPRAAARQLAHRGPDPARPGPRRPAEARRLAAARRRGHAADPRPGRLAGGRRRRRPPRDCRSRTPALNRTPRNENYAFSGGFDGSNRSRSFSHPYSGVLSG